MASGDALYMLAPPSGIPPSANYATLDTVSDASTPNIILPVYDFDGATDEHMDWIITVPDHYAGTTGFTFKYYYAMDGVDADQVEIEIRAIVVADLDTLTADLGVDTQTAVAITDTPSGTANQFNYSTTGALAKANMDTPSARDVMLIRATRDVSIATNTDDLQLAAIYMFET